MYITTTIYYYLLTIHIRIFIINTNIRVSHLIFLMNFSYESISIKIKYIFNIYYELLSYVYLPCIHDGVLVIATIQKYTAGKDEQTGEQQQQYFETFFAAIDEIAVEHVRILGRRKTVFVENHQQIVEFTVQITANGDLLRDGRWRLIQIR